MHQVGALSADQLRLATAMITKSDNDAASVLYAEIGGADGLDAFDASAGLTETIASTSWGLTTTSAADQVRLLRLLGSPNRLLTHTQRRYELALMRSVIASQCWGVKAGVPAGVSVALKNGWLQLPAGLGGGWQLNSVGYVHGLGRRYFIAVLSNSPDYGYGIATIDQVSRLVWPYMTAAS